MAPQAINKICMFPSGAKGYYVRLQPTLLFGIQGAAGRRKVLIKETMHDFLQQTCASCTFFIDKDEADHAINLLQTQDIETYRAKYQGFPMHKVRQMWADDQQKCIGMDLAPKCRAQKTHTGKKVIEVNVYDHFFIWNPLVKGSSTYRFFASKEDARARKFFLMPYMFGNVYDNSTICWGRNPTPPNLKNAYNTYWSAPFNGDLTSRGGNTLETWMQNWSPDRSGRVWQDYTNEYFGDGVIFATRTKECEGVMVTSSPKTLDLLPDAYKIRSGSHTVCCAWIRHDPNNIKDWYLNFIRFTPDEQGRRLPLLAKRIATKATSTARLLILGTVESIT